MAQNVVQVVDLLRSEFQSEVAFACIIIAIIRRDGNVFFLLDVMMVQLFDGICAILPVINLAGCDHEKSVVDAAWKESFLELTLGFVRHLDHRGKEGKEQVIHYN